MTAAALALLAAVGVSGAPPADDGRPAYLPRPWTEAAARDAAVDAFEVFVDGRRVPVLVAEAERRDWGADRWGGDYFFASFEVGDRPARVRVKSRFALDGAEVRPERHGVRAERLNAKEVAFEVPRPMRLALEHDGRRQPLLLFANPPERDAPRPGDAGVVWFGPGYHNPGKISLASNQTLYLAPGAVVSGGVEARGTNVAVRGRGVLDGRAYRRFQGPTRWCLDFTGCRGVRLEGVTVRNPWNWIVVLLDCEDVLIENVKVCGGRMINDDALDLCNVRRAVVRDSFFRSSDDVFAVKGNLPFGARMTAVEDVLIEDCEAWTDAANAFRIGFECNATRFRKIRARRVDVLHAAANQRPVTHDWANCVFFVQPSNGMAIDGVTFDDVRVRAEGPLALFSAYSRAWGCLGRPYETAGALRNVGLRDVAVTSAGRNGADGWPVGVSLRGESEACAVEGVLFRNVTADGVRLTRESPGVTVGPFVRKVVFK